MHAGRCSDLADLADLTDLADLAVLAVLADLWPTQEIRAGRSPGDADQCGASRGAPRIS